MSENGRGVLYALRDLERENPRTGYVQARYVAERVGRHDGRAVTRVLQKLEDVGLVERWPELTLPNWRSTPRGREVARLCARYDGRRGGTFRPMVEWLSDMRERHALL